MLFFILPVKIKYLAWLTWFGFAVAFFGGTWSTRLAVVAGIGNFLLFFGADIVSYVKDRQRKTQQALKSIGVKQRVFHKCTICGVTEKSDPQMDFRYCSKCEGDFEYCADHLRNHEHRTAESAEL